jgi:AraC family transcriptional regulator
MTEVSPPSSFREAPAEAAPAGSGTGDLQWWPLRLAAAPAEWAADSHWRVAFNVGPAYHFETRTDTGASRSLVCRRHALVVVPPGQAVLHRPLPGRTPADAELAVMRLPTSLLAQSAMALGLQFRDAQLDHQVVATDELLRLHVQALLTDLRDDRPDGAAATERTAAALAMRLLARNASRKAPAAMGAMDRVQAFINANLSSELALERLAAIAGMSLFHFCRVFRDHAGVTPHQYIVARRLDHAKSLLWANRGSPEEAMSVLEVARACGFNSPSHFAAQFKRHTGKTPMQWQREG